VKRTDHGQSALPAASFNQQRILAESIAESLHEPLVVLDNDLKVLSANRAFYETFRASPADTLYRPLFDVHGRLCAFHDFRSLLDEMMRTGEPIWAYELQCDFPVLGRRFLLVNARVLQSADDLQHDNILLAITDVTDHRDGEASLRESEQRYRLMAQEVIDYAIFSLDTDGRIVTWSEGAHRMKQYTEDEVLGEHFRMLYPEEDRASHKPERELSVVVRDGRVKDFGWRRKKDGSLFWAEVVITAMHDAAGELIGFGKVVKDLTEANRIAEEREQLREYARSVEIREKEKAFLRDVLLSVTNRKLYLCGSAGDLPPHGDQYGTVVSVTEDTMSRLRRLSLKGAQSERFDTERIQDLITAVGEAAMNAVVHGGGGEGKVCLVGSGSGAATVQVWIEDKGEGITLEHIPKATLLKGHSTAGSLGHGFFLMLQTVDRVWLLTGSAGTIVVLEKDQRPSGHDW
jgi:PAS domain S-box-containing protein